MFVGVESEVMRVGVGVGVDGFVGECEGIGGSVEVVGDDFIGVEVGGVGEVVVGSEVDVVGVCGILLGVWIFVGVFYEGCVCVELFVGSE